VFPHETVAPFEIWQSVDEKQIVQQVKMLQALLVTQFPESDDRYYSIRTSVSSSIALLAATTLKRKVLSAIRGWRPSWLSFHPPSFVLLREQPITP
jgi:hypothetical protein